MNQCPSRSQGQSVLTQGQSVSTSSSKGQRGQGVMEKKGFHLGQTLGNVGRRVLGKGVMISIESCDYMVL